MFRMTCSAAVIASAAFAATTASAAPQTRYFSCAGFDFHPIDSRTQTRWQGRYMQRRTKDGDGWFMCHANLPHRARVTRVRFIIEDTVDSVGYEFCGLVRTPLSVAPAPVQVLALPVSGIGIADMPGVVRLTDTAIDFAVVDNANFSYSLQCRIVFSPSLVQIVSGGGGIIGADITYSIEPSNG